MAGHSTHIPVRALPGLALAAALAAGAAPALSQTAAISYPPSRALGDIAAWLQRDTPLTPAQVVDVSPAAITAVTAAAPMGETRGFLANIASEAVDPQMLAHDGIASWSIPVEVDCDRRQVRLGTMTGYRSRDLRSDSRTVREADMTWVNPTPSAPLGAVIRALCDRDFKRPLIGQVRMAAKGSDPVRSGGRAGKLPVIVAPPSAKVAKAAKGEPKAEPKPDAAAAAPAPAPALATASPATAAPAPPAAKTAAPPVAAPTPAAAVAAAPKPKPKPKPPVGGGAFALQIGASPTPADAQLLVTRFKKKFGADLGGVVVSVAPAQLDGKPVNRVLLSGFASSGEAERFCQMLSAAHQACFIRR